MKKILAMILAAMMLLALAACGTTADETSAPPSDDAAVSDAPAEESEAPSEPAEAQYLVGICQQMTHDALDSATQGFKDALADILGEGAVEYSEGNAGGEQPNCVTIIDGLVSENVDLILANATWPLQAAYSATSEIPVLGTSVTDYGTAAKGTVAVSILTSESNTVEFNIGRYDIGDIQVGQKATATIGGVEYPGTVTHIDSVAKDDSVRAEVTLDNPEGVVPGISAELDIETYLNENCLTIPIEASKTDRTGDYCYVARDNGDGTYRPEKVYITTGNSSLTSVEVLEGLNEGDIVITNPPANIENMTSASLILA